MGRGHGYGAKPQGPTNQWKAGLAGVKLIDFGDIFNDVYYASSGPTDHVCLRRQQLARSLLNVFAYIAVHEVMLHNPDLMALMTKPRRKQQLCAYLEVLVERMARSLCGNVRTVQEYGPSTLSSTAERTRWFLNAKYKDGDDTVVQRQMLRFERSWLLDGIHALSSCGTVPALYRPLVNAMAAAIDMKQPYRSKDAYMGVKLYLVEHEATQGRRNAQAAPPSPLFLSIVDIAPEGTAPPPRFVPVRRELPVCDMEVLETVSPRRRSNKNNGGQVPAQVAAPSSTPATAGGTTEPVPAMVAGSSPARVTASAALDLHASGAEAVSTRAEAAAATTTKTPKLVLNRKERKAAKRAAERAAKAAAMAAAAPPSEASVFVTRVPATGNIVDAVKGSVPTPEPSVLLTGTQSARSPLTDHAQQTAIIKYVPWRPWQLACAVASKDVTETGTGQAIQHTSEADVQQATAHHSQLDVISLVAANSTQQAALYSRAATGLHHIAMLMSADMVVGIRHLGPCGTGNTAVAMLARMAAMTPARRQPPPCSPLGAPLRLRGPTPSPNGYVITSDLPGPTAPAVLSASSGTTPLEHTFNFLNESISCGDLYRGSLCDPVTPWQVTLITRLRSAPGVMRAKQVLAKILSWCQSTDNSRGCGFVAAVVQARRLVPDKVCMPGVTHTTAVDLSNQGLVDSESSPRLHVAAGTSTAASTADTNIVAIQDAATVPETKHSGLFDKMCSVVKWGVSHMYRAAGAISGILCGAAACITPHV